jgi:hypothetical protein
MMQLSFCRGRPPSRTLSSRAPIFDQHFVGRRGVEAALDDVEKFFAVVGNAAAGAAHGEGRADDRRQADLGQRHHGLTERIFLIALAAVAFMQHPLALVFGQRLAGKLGLLRLMLVAILLFQIGGIGEPRLRRFKPDLLHRLAEQLAILGLVDGIGGGADHLDIEFLQGALTAQRQRAVQRGLAAHGRQQRKAAGKDIAFLLDDLGDNLGVIGSI